MQALHIQPVQHPFPSGKSSLRIHLRPWPTAALPFPLVLLALTKTLRGDVAHAYITPQVPRPACPPIQSPSSPRPAPANLQPQTYASGLLIGERDTHTGGCTGAVSTGTSWGAWSDVSSSRSGRNGLGKAKGTVHFEDGAGEGGDKNTLEVVPSTAKGGGCYFAANGVCGHATRAGSFGEIS